MGSWEMARYPRNLALAVQGVREESMAATSERHIPYNKAIKIALLASHYFGF